MAATVPSPRSIGDAFGSSRTGDVRDGTTSVLAIEDDPDIRQLLRALLDREGYTVTEAASGRDGLRAFHQARPDLVILDLGLPDLDGWQVLERIRDMSDAPVLVLTARSAERDKVRGLNAGADDYLTKPFSRVELLARLQAIRRRQVAGSSPRAVFDDGVVRVDFVHQQVLLDGQAVVLTPTEYRLLAAMVRHAGQILSADQLIELAWDDPSGLAPARVKYAVLRLRRKLGWDDADTSPLETVRGFGYRYRQQRG
jgi:DNA-binding response OmpR family regulator